MRKIARKFTLLFTVIALAMLSVVPSASATDNEPAPPSENKGPCTNQQVKGGYEPSADGTSCVLTGWNWDFGGACPRSNDAGVGQHGSVDCSQGECIICSTNTGDAGGSTSTSSDDECVDLYDCFTDEEDGVFTQLSIGHFIETCLRLDGAPSTTDVDFAHVGTCTFPDDYTAFSCYAEPPALEAQCMSFYFIPAPDLPDYGHIDMSEATNPQTVEAPGSATFTGYPDAFSPAQPAHMR